MMLHRHVKIFVVVVVILVWMAALIPAMSIIARPQAQEFAATIKPLSGLVQRYQADQGTWQTLTKIELMRSGDQVRTGDVGTAQLSTVTGIKMNIYPNTVIQLKSLALSTTDDSRLTFVITQTSGVTYMDVSRILKATDNVQVVTPPFIATARGARFYTFVGRTGSAAVISEGDSVELQGVKGAAVKIGADNVAYYTLDFSATSPAACSTDLLGQNGYVVLKDLQSDTNRTTLRSFLADFLESNINLRSTSYAAALLSLGDVNAKQLIDAVPTFDRLPPLPVFSKDLRGVLVDYFTATSGNALAPVTCGNGKQDANESAANCKEDTADVSASCGNNLCETGRGESVVNCSADCLPYGQLAQSCTETLNTTVNASVLAAAGVAARPSGSSTGGSGPLFVTTIPDTPTPVPLSTPVPSGSGGP